MELATTHILSATVLFWAIILYYGFKIGALQYMYKLQKNVKKISGPKKKENCAVLFKEAIKFRAVLGEANSHFWSSKEVLEALDIFINKKDSQMQIVMGPNIDVRNILFLKKVVQAMDSGKAKIFRLKQRKNHHIKEYITEQGKKTIVAEKPHLPLSRDRDDLLECINDRDCENRMNQYYSKALEEAERVDKNEIISKFNFISTEKEITVQATEKEIDKLKEFIYAS